MKKTLSLVLSLLLVLCVLCSCTNQTETASPAAVESTQPTENTQPAETAAQDKIVISLAATYTLPEFEAAFEKAYPNVDLQVEKMPTATINGEISRRLLKGHGLDLIITNLPAGDIASYTYDLSAESFVESYESSMTKSITVDGKNCYLPLPGSYYGYFVNKTLLDELGLAIPETTDDLLAILAAAKEKGIGVSADTGCGFGLSDTGATFIGAYFAAGFATDFLSTAAGVKWISAFYEKNATLTGNLENSVTFLQTCVSSGYLDPNKLIVYYNGRLDSDSNAFKAEEQIPARTAIISYGNLEMYNMIQSRTKDEIIMLPCLPKDSTGNKLVSAVSNNFIAVNNSLSGDAQKLEAALQVLAFLSTTEGQTCWMHDSECPYSYLVGMTTDLSGLPESIRPYVESGMVFSNPFPTNLLSYLGKNLTMVVKGSQTIGDALGKIDEYYLNGSEDVEYDLSYVGTVSRDMVYENANTRVKETEIGNFISDAIREVTGADVALVNGGGIRSSLYKGDITGEDLLAVCPYGNLIIVAEVDGATLRQAITNGIQKTWKPAGQFLQVSGIRYSFKPAADETQTAELVSLTYADGTEVKDTDVIKVAYTNYMGGSSGYVDAGDGFTMLNVYDSSVPVTVHLVEETNKTYADALKEYFAMHQDKELVSELDGRIEVLQ